MYLKNWIISALAFAVMQSTTLADGTAHSKHQQHTIKSNPQLVAEAQGGHFALQTPDGVVSLHDTLGKVTLLFFGFTSCVDVCPTTLWSVSRAFSKLTEDELEKVLVLFVSVDPDYDTLPVLEKYTALFHPKIIGATDSLENLKTMAKNYGVEFEREEIPDAPRGYMVSHTPDILLINPNGELLKTRIEHPPTSEEIIVAVRELLTQS